MAKGEMKQIAIYGKGRHLRLLRPPRQRLPPRHPAGPGLPHPAAGRAGARLQNIIPLLPLGAFAARRPPTCEELRAARDRTSRHIPQFRLCRQCRADAFEVPGEEEAAP